MEQIDIRKTQIAIEDIWHERGPRRTLPVRVATASAVVRNPFADRYEPDLRWFQDELRSVGKLLSGMLIEALGREVIQAYGKGAIVGEDGELEHGALWHEAGGWALREALGHPKAIVPAAKTVASLGCRLMIPLGHIHAAYVRSHFSTAELSIWDAPRRNEIIFGLAAATDGRPHERAGGLAAADVVGADGLR
ncbi:amino acid synthesis family protein [Sphingopyxis granuli]|uniref:amino acid synthesis family protein n=1 Tax=Sphingopyxis granuli TaxID=267128 RepID=UPI001BAE5943|nr:amino acid synthesis family protein [Sphingopyxis granuli]QUM71024.1 amino acid synthesis family protein [Sphingopyxis granuli]